MNVIADADHTRADTYTDRNERSFRCEECPAAFNRRDLLLRHQATHAKNAADGLVGPNRVAERATKACNSCVISKVKCDNGRPCKRCQKKGFACLTKCSESPVPQTSAEEERPPLLSASADEQVIASQFEDGTQGNDVYMAEATTDAQALLDLYNTTGYNQHSIPAFFEQIMVPAPDYMGVDFMQPPPDLTAWMPEGDWLGEVDIFGNDFTPVIDQMLVPQMTQGSNLPIETQEASVTDTSHERIDNNSAKRRYAVFKQSPWSVAPTF